MATNTKMQAVEAGLIFLIEKEPLYALTLIEFDRITTTGATPFAMVGRDKGGKLGLYTNNENLSKYNRVQIGYVFAHELLHVILMHFQRHPENSHLWNVAEDLAINDMFRESSMKTLFGEDCILPGCFPSEGIYKDLPRQLNADQYYELLLKGNYHAEKTGQWTIKVTNKKGESQEITVSGTPQLSKEDKQQIERIVKEAAKKAMGQGKISQGLKLLCEDFLKDRIDWPRQVQNMVGTVRSIKTRSIYKFSRKYDDMVGSKRTHKLAMVVVRDTSGSVSDENIRRFRGVAENVKKVGGTVFVMDCDSSVDNAYWLKTKWATGKTTKDVVGRGGTSFVPPFQYIRKHKIPCDVLIYLTDLEGDFPTGKDIFRNTIWVTVRDHDIPFGKKILIPDAE